MGTTPSATPASVRASHVSSTWARRAMSAIEHPAARSGSTTFCSGEVRMSADSAMNGTPQKRMFSVWGRDLTNRARGGRQVAGALHAALRGAVGAESQRQQGKVDGRHDRKSFTGSHECVVVQVGRRRGHAGQGE